MMQRGMMGGMMQMMHQRMMEDPMMRSVMRVYTLPALEEPLELDEEQVRNLEEEQERFTQEREQRRAELRETQEQLRNELSTDNPDMLQVETLLQEVATRRADQVLAAIEVSTDMMDVLTDAQRDDLEELPPEERHRAIMEHMTMMEMMRMMQDMRMIAMMNGMQQRGMMPGNMMDNGGM